jgi:outer membrane protein assembly factor BamB
MKMIRCIFIAHVGTTAISNKNVMIRTNSKYSIILAATIFVALAFTSCTSKNWPQFRGPDNNMVVTGKNLPTEWGEDTNVRWTYEMNGDSWSSPVVWGNKVFVASASPQKVLPLPEEDRSNLEDVYRWQVACVDIKTGAELWKQVAFEGNPRISKHSATNYAGETPVTDGKRLYVYFGMTGLYCYDLDGELLWEKDLGAYETQRGWGTGSSPLIYRGVLYVQVDNEESSFLVAIDADTGEEIWKIARDEKTNYNTPVIWKNRVRTELVTGGKKARGYDPETGELLWELAMAGHYTIPSAVSDRDHLFIGNEGYRDIPSTLFAVKAGASGDITPAEGEEESSGVVWSSLDAPTGRPSPLLYDGLLYLLSSRGGEISCFEAATGEIIYQEKFEKVGACWASPWVYDGNIYFFDEKGVTNVIKAGREFEVLHQNRLDDKFWASVAVAGDAYLIKGVERLYCISN